jgi:hypothetical protein
MSRRRRRAALTVSLFPFLSVLACVIGTLTLMIAALAIGQMVVDFDIPANATALEAQRETMLQGWIDKIAEHSASVSAAATQNQHLSTIRSKLAAYGIGTRIRGAELERLVSLKIRAAELRKQEALLAADTQTLEAKIEGIRVELEKTNAPPSGAPIEILPRGDSRNLVPFFIECRGDAVRVRTRDGGWSADLHISDLVHRGRFKVILENIRRRRGATAIFLIRGDGIDIYEIASELADEAYVRHGKLPIPGEGDLDFRFIDATKPDGEEEKS